MIEIGPNLAGTLQWAVFCASAVAIIAWGAWLVATKFELGELSQYVHEPTPSTTENLPVFKDAR